MKKALIFIGLLFLCACSNNETSDNTYEYKQQKEYEEEILPSSYQVTVDESFGMISKYEKGLSRGHMYFWHKPSVSEYPFELETTQADLEKEVPTIEIKPINKYANYLLYAADLSFFMENYTEEETQKIIKQKVEEDSERQVEEIKDRLLEEEGSESGSTVYTTEEYDVVPFTYMIQSEAESGITRYHFVGEAEEDYLIATLSIPNKEKENEELLESMVASLQTITYDENKFKQNPVLDEPTHLSYEPAENLKGRYPSMGYSFELPEAATFRYSFPVFHTYRYTFATVYEEGIEKEHFTLNSSELSIRVEKEEHARNREEEMRSRDLDDFVPYQHDYARSITYLHEDKDFNTGVFTAGIRVEFDGYEEYWFLKEINGHVYEVTFDIAFEVSEYDELLDSYLNVIRTFELKGVKE